MTIKKSIAAIATSLLVLSAAACTADEQQPADPAPPPATAPQAPAPTEETTSGAATTDADDQAPEERNQGALQAIATAADAAGGTPYEIDDSDDDGSWEVDVMVGERSHEVKVSADGQNVVEQEEDDSDGDDRERLGQAGLSMAQAIEAALREVPGTLDDVELDEEDGAPVWEVTIDTPDQDDIEVYIDVRDGNVVKVDR
ncbi:PepSY domain-containing protein [Granulicoccus sp. GXG6511]|uniref:PepSY domain-containing protein n=1 Tax=Granulicoccus sp. GXG6511 TaxID=3381351 RepID=UPI003D7D1A45